MKAILKMGLLVFAFGMCGTAFGQTTPSSTAKPLNKEVKEMGTRSPEKKKTTKANVRAVPQKKTSAVLRKEDRQ